MAETKKLHKRNNNGVVGKNKEEWKMTDRDKYQDDEEQEHLLSKESPANNEIDEIQEENNHDKRNSNKQSDNSLSVVAQPAYTLVRQTEYEVSILYLISLTFTLGLSSMQFMLALNGTCQIASALRYQQSWGNDQGRIDFYITVLSTASIIGISAGSLFGGDCVKAYGPKKTIIQFNTLGLVGSMLSLSLNFKVMCLGRFFFGLAGGVLLCATSRILEETIPVRLLDKGFGTSTNILMQLFNFALLLMAIGMPEKQAELESTQWWRCIYGVQVPFQVVVLILHTFVFTEEPIEFCLQQGDKPQALRAIKKIFSRENELTHEIIYQERHAEYQRSLQEKSNGVVSVWSTLTDPNLRGSTWMAIWVAVFNILSGVSIVTVYAIIIFEKLLNNGQPKGKAARLTSKQDSYFVGFASLTGAILSYYSIAIFSRRAIFIGGHFFMGILLMTSGYYIHINQPELVLLSFCTFVVVYQASQGSCLFIYVAEVVVNEVAMGLAMFSLMLAMTIQSMFSTYLINCKMGLDIVFYSLGLIQLVPFLYFSFCLRETQGLSIQQKKKLYMVASADSEEAPLKKGAAK